MDTTFKQAGQLLTDHPKCVIAASLILLLVPKLYPKYEEYLPSQLRQVIRTKFKSSTALPVAARAPKTPKLLDPPVITPVSDDFDWTEVTPYKFRPFKNGEYKMTLAIRKLDPLDLLVLEDTYLNRINIKKSILKERPEAHRACHESGIEPVRETYDLVLDFLLKRYPKYFVKSDDGTTFTNNITGDSYPIDNSSLTPDEMLDTISFNIEDDFLILVKNSDEPEFDEYMLRATVTCFPAGFNPVEKVNKPLTKIHDPVPGYRQRLQTSMNRFFSRLRPYEYIVRNNWSIQAHTNLSAPVGNHATPEEVAQIEAVDPSTLDFNKVFLRVEKQSFTRLPKCGADLMFIRTYTTPLTEIRAEGRGEDLCGAIDGLNEELGIYKRRIYWGKAAKAYLRHETNGITDEVYPYTFEN